MNRFNSQLLIRCTTLFLVYCSAVPAAAIYDLRTDWSDTNNSNGAWAYRQGRAPPRKGRRSSACSSNSK